MGSLILIIMHIGALPNAFRMIFVGAFNPEAVLGAGAGIAVREAIRYGVARGLSPTKQVWVPHLTRTQELTWKIRISRDLLP